MLRIHIENLGNIAMVECEGRIVQSEAAFRLRDAVTSQREARIVVLDLSAVSAIEGGGLGMLWYLQRWAQENDIRLTLFNPASRVRDRLCHVNSMLQFDIATPAEMTALVAANRQSSVAA